LLVRDRLGIKPLFYAASTARIAAASELGALMAMGVTEPRADLRAVDDYLTYLYVPPPRTGIVGCRELRPGHLLRWKPGHEAVIERYWAVPSASAGRVSPGKLRSVIDDSVRCHLVSDTPVGVFLSGGLDSSTIVALAARHYPGALQTFCVTFGDEGRYLDERSFAKEVATRFGTHHREIRVAADVAQILPELVAHFGQPFGNPTAVLAYALSRATREFVKVALAGDGGDEVLGGYPRYQGVWLAELARKAPASARNRAARWLEGITPTSAPRGVSTDRVRRFLTHVELPLETMYYRWVSYLDEARKSLLLVDREGALAADRPIEEFEFLAAIRRQYGARSMRDAAPLIDLQSFLPHNVLNYGDRMSMAHSLEVRVPFCDHVLVEALAPLPLATKLPAGLQKGLFRWALRGDLPSRVITHRKVGFNPPIAAWLRGALGPVVDEYLSESAVRRRGLLVRTAVSDLRDAFAAGRQDAAYTIWSLVVLEAWLRWLEASDRRGTWRVAA
jgi:asparagine synthase (glutamine-hydrolysing)